MIPRHLDRDFGLDNMVRYIEWKFTDSEAPTQGDLETVGQLVVENIISESNCKIGDALVKFRVEHYGRRKTPEGLKHQISGSLPGAVDDDLTLVADFTWRPALKADEEPRVRTVNDMVLYRGASFQQLWAVWRSWMNAGKDIVFDLEELVCEERRKEEEVGNEEV